MLTGEMASTLGGGGGVRGDRRYGEARSLIYGSETENSVFSRVSDSRPHWVLIPSETCPAQELPKQWVFAARETPRGSHAG